jgi:hypothetical protein
MFSLQNFIETEYCLIVQDDGWVIDFAGHCVGYRAFAA